MIAEWIMAGVAFGVKAFFAVLVFGTAWAAVLAVIGALAGLFGGRDDA